MNRGGANSTERRLVEFAESGLVLGQFGSNGRMMSVNVLCDLACALEKRVITCGARGVSELGAVYQGCGEESRRNMSPEHEFRRSEST